jgi:hypothetical protein
MKTGRSICRRKRKTPLDHRRDPDATPTAWLDNTLFVIFLAKNAG